jgi:predicted RNA-binding Zn-ribbon protein involved in translation (DUF1610 family)
VSNTRKLRGAAASRSAERCTSCRRRIGAGMDVLRLRTGQVICPRCQQSGSLPRLPCGHVALPGTLMTSDSTEGNYQCPKCSPHAARFGNLRLGMAPRKAG